MGNVYTGENALHIAVVNGNHEMVRLLCERRPNVLTHHAKGSFFAPSGSCYYGELPLSFAVCTNQRDMVTLLLDMGAPLDGVDHVHGNTALHMAVLRDLKEMFDVLRDEWARRHPKRRRCLSDVRNNLGQTCLTLAAAKGSVEMFDHVLTSRCSLAWGSCIVHQGLPGGLPHLLLFVHTTETGWLSAVTGQPPTVREGTSARRAKSPPISPSFSPAPFSQGGALSAIQLRVPGRGYIDSPPSTIWGHVFVWDFLP